MCFIFRRQRISRQARAITNAEGDRLLRILRRGSGSVVTWRRADDLAIGAGRARATHPQSWVRK